MHGDEENIERVRQVLWDLGFRGPKWTFGDHTPISQLTCSKRRLECDLVAYRNGKPVVVLELDGFHHNTDKQKAYDGSKERILGRHSIRVVRVWNSEIFHIENGRGRGFRRDMKASFYAPYGELRTDFNHLCEECL